MQPVRSSTVPAKFQEMVQSMFSPRSKRMKLDDAMQPERSGPSARYPFFLGCALMSATELWTHVQPPV